MPVAEEAVNVFVEDPAAAPGTSLGKAAGSAIKVSVKGPVIDLFDD